MTNKVHASYLFPESQPQGQHYKQDVAIRNLFNDRNIYENYPDFQRGYVWPDKYNRDFIDSILRGFPIHPLLAYKETDAEGMQKYWLLDGRQRLSAVYSFMEGKFRTSTASQNKEEERNATPIEPNRTFQELSDRSRNYFLNYTFSINVIDDGIDKIQREMLFRRIQNQLKLTLPEKLATYDSVAVDYARQLQSHLIWSKFYTGADTRKQILQGNLILISLELAQGYTSLNGRLSEVASGLKDNKITPALYEAIEDRLEVVMHVFEGAAFSKITTIIPMYQAVMHLEEQGYTFTSSNKGCLTSWIGQVLHEANRTGLQGFSHPITMLRNVNQQVDFWDEQLPLVIDYCKRGPESVA